jgi:hypothetical protein
VGLAVANLIKLQHIKKPIGQSLSTDSGPLAELQG